MAGHQRRLQSRRKPLSSSLSRNLLLGAPQLQVRCVRGKLSPLASALDMLRCVPPGGRRQRSPTHSKSRPRSRSRSRSRSPGRKRADRPKSSSGAYGRKRTPAVGGRPASRHVRFNTDVSPPRLPHVVASPGRERLSPLPLGAAAAAHMTRAGQHRRASDSFLEWERATTARAAARRMSALSLPAHRACSVVSGGWQQRYVQWCGPGMHMLTVTTCMCGLAHGQTPSRSILNL